MQVHIDKVTIGHLTINLEIDDDGLEIVLGRVDEMSAQLDELTEAVAAQGTVVDSTAALVVTLLAQIEAAKDDPVQVQAIIDEVRANTKQLSDLAVTPPVIS